MVLGFLFVGVVYELNNFFFVVIGCVLMLWDLLEDEKVKLFGEKIVDVV